MSKLVCSQMNNLKKILQLVVDYYNEVGSRHWHIIYVVFRADVVQTLS